MLGSFGTPTVSFSVPRRESAEFPSMWQTCSPLLSPGGLSSESKPWTSSSSPTQRRSHHMQTEGRGDTFNTSSMLVTGTDSWGLTRWPVVEWCWISAFNYLCHLPPNIKPRSREFITNQPPNPFQKPPPKPCSNCLHPVIRQINGRAWNVAFTSTKVKCCREGVAFGLWLVDYALRNPLNASIIWWSCQFAVCALSLPHFLFLLPPKTKADFAPRLLRRIWSLERRRYM